MIFHELSVETVIEIHDSVLNPGEIPGLARDKSLDGALGRVSNRLTYGLIDDVPHLAATYGEAISQGNCFKDGNKRTAYQSIIVCLFLHGLTFKHDTKDAGDRIIALAQGKTHADAIAAWIRQKL